MTVSHERWFAQIGAGAFVPSTHNAKDAGLEPIVACQRVLKRMCEAVTLILDTAEKLQEVEATI